MSGVKQEESNQCFSDCILLINRLKTFFLSTRHLSSIMLMSYIVAVPHLSPFLSIFIVLHHFNTRLRYVKFHDEWKNRNASKSLGIKSTKKIYYNTSSALLEMKVLCRYISHSSRYKQCKFISKVQQWF